MPESGKVVPWLPHGQVRNPPKDNTYITLALALEADGDIGT